MDSSRLQNKTYVRFFLNLDDLHGLHEIFLFYYIKVSGIASGNKLIRYDILTCEDIDDFSDIRFVSYKLYLNSLVDA